MSINLKVPFLQIGPPMALVVVAIMIFSILIYTVLSWKIYRNNKNKIEPVHVFQLNYFIGVSSKLCYGIFSAIAWKIFVRGNSHSLCIHQFFGLFCFSNSSLDIIIMQVDRVLAIYKPLWHQSELTTSIAVKTCVFIKIVSLAHAILAGVLDPESVHCSDCLRCMHTMPAYLYTNSYPKLIALTLTITVSGYVAVKMYRAENKIIPIQSNPVPRQTNSGNQVTSGKEIGQSEVQESLPLSELEVKKLTLSKENKISEEEAGATSSSVQTSNDQTNKKRTNILALNIFQETDPVYEQQRKLKKRMLVVMKTALTMNFLTLLLMMSMLPMHVVNIVYKNCTNNSSGCVDFLRLVDPLTGLRILALFIHPLIVLFKVKNIHPITGN